MTKKIIILIAAILLVVTWYVVSWLGFFKTSLAPGQVFNFTNSVPAAQDQLPTEVPYVVEEVAKGLYVPWSIVFTSDDRILFTERSGSLRVINQGQLQAKPLYVFSEVSTTGEEGLMSIALDPDYAQSKLIYISLAYQKGSNMFVKVVRFKDAGDSLAEQKIIIDNIPAAQYHAGSRVKFGPDGKLYITSGDATDRALAQDLKSLAGKILRLNPDGSIPSDNPWPNSAVWSYGHRNPQGLAWSSLNNELYSTEHGPSVFDGPAGGDEINHIVKGGNYGWPLVSHTKQRAGTIAPLLLFTPAEAPGSLLNYSGNALPQFKDNWFLGALKGEGIIRFVVDSQNPDKVSSFEKLKDVQFGRIREVMQGPDDFIYFSTSNMDGRGSPAKADDRIFRIRPK